MEEDEEAGPVVDRKCPRCENEKMSYVTLQLRSADEGQTVFYTCTRCNFKESENSWTLIKAMLFRISLFECKYYNVKKRILEYVSWVICY